MSVLLIHCLLPRRIHHHQPNIENSGTYSSNGASDFFARVKIPSDADILHTVGTHQRSFNGSEEADLIEFLLSIDQGLFIEDGAAYPDFE